MDRPRRNHSRPTPPSRRGNLPHLHRLPRSRPRHPRNGHSRRSRHRRSRSHGCSTRRPAFLCKIGRRIARGIPTNLRRHRQDSPHRGRSLLGARTHESPFRRTHGAVFRPEQNQTGLSRRSPASPPRKESHGRSHRPLRRGIHASRRPGHDPMQCRSASHRRNRHGPRRNSRRVRTGEKNPRASSRNAPLSPRRAPHRLGAAPRRHSPDAHHRQHGGSFPKVRKSGRRRHRSRPHRRQRRHRQQNRHLSNRRPRQRKQRPLLHRRAGIHLRSFHSQRRPHPH